MTHSVGLLLLAAVGGYWVLERAETHKKGLKRIGRLVAAVVMIVSLVGVLCKVWCVASGNCVGMGKWGMHGGYCPMSGKIPHASPAP
ncbi:MAG: hypothetical protein HY737_03985 [Candidatus Omnitrophica bacterium]|nr:hypothetical protein [Candidatus Omnitrophota bacterium]